MLRSLFPYGTIVVFYVLFVLVMISLGVGAAIEARYGKDYTNKRTLILISVILASLIVSYLVYHFIGWIGS